MPSTLTNPREVMTAAYLLPFFSFESTQSAYVSTGRCGYVYKTRVGKKGGSFKKERETETERGETETQRETDRDTEREETDRQTDRQTEKGIKIQSQ